MAYLGHKNGPKMSEILKRRREELSKLVKSVGRGPDKVPLDTIRNLIESEEKEEAMGNVVPVKIPVGWGVRPGEFIYISYDIDTDKGVEFYYTLNEEERKMLGDTYDKKQVTIKSPAEAQMDWAIREEIMGRGEFG